MTAASMPEQLPSCFEKCSTDIVLNDDPADADPEKMLKFREEAAVARDTKWSAFGLCDGDVDQHYRKLATVFNVDCETRHLIVARVRDTNWAVLNKLDHERIAKLPDCIHNAYDIVGPKRSGVSTFARCCSRGPPNSKRISSRSAPRRTTGSRWTPMGRPTSW